eukprot:SAG31_NODE_3348_length_4376_cov_2.145429_3_plen_93_part_00
MQAYLAQRAERASHEQGLEMHAAELRRQREHEQMVAQVSHAVIWPDTIIVQFLRIDPECATDSPDRQLAGPMLPAINEHDCQRNVVPSTLHF